MMGKNTRSHADISFRTLCVIIHLFYSPITFFEYFKNVYYCIRKIYVLEPQLIDNLVLYVQSRTVNIFHAKPEHGKYRRGYKNTQTDNGDGVFV